LPISTPSHLIPIDKIHVLRQSRQRQDEESRQKNIETLAKSIARVGLINPITVRHFPPDELETVEAMICLVAGECRLEACRLLGWSEIPARFAEELSEADTQLIELEENIKRTDLTWQDQIAAIRAIHRLYLARDPDWTHADTAEACSLDRSTITMYLRVEEEIQRGTPNVASAVTARQAYNIAVRRDAREAGNALEELLSTPTIEESLEMVQRGFVIPPTIPLRSGPASPSETILNESFLEWAPLYSGPPFNFIHCDFPYGINPFSGSQGRNNQTVEQYQDNPQLYFDLCGCLFENLPRLLAASGHLMFWYSTPLYRDTMAILGASSSSGLLSFYPHPLIWLKSDNSGIASRPAHWPRHTYETALLASRGDRQIVRIASDAYAAPTANDIHPSTKPIPVLKHFFGMLVDELTSMLDPTCGSGSALRAAEELGASATLGLEISSQYCEDARRELRNFRLLRGR